MQVSSTHHIDASEPDADGDYEYYYEYDIFVFTEGGLSLTARSYSDESSQASLMGLEQAGKHRALEYKDLKRPLVQQAVDHLRSIGKTEVRWFNPKYARYEPV